MYNTENVDLYIFICILRYEYVYMRNGVRILYV